MKKLVMFDCNSHVNEVVDDIAGILKELRVNVTEVSTGGDSYAYVISDEDVTQEEADSLLEEANGC